MTNEFSANQETNHELDVPEKIKNMKKEVKRVGWHMCGGDHEGTGAFRVPECIETTISGESLGVRLELSRSDYNGEWETSYRAVVDGVCVGDRAISKKLFEEYLFLLESFAANPTGEATRKAMRLLES